MVHLVLAVLMLFVGLFSQPIMAVENTSWGSVKAEFSKAPAGKLVVSQMSASSKAERNFLSASSINLHINITDFDSVDGSYSSDDFRYGDKDTAVWYAIEFSRCISGKSRNWFGGALLDHFPDPPYGSPAESFMNIRNNRGDAGGLYSFRLVRRQGQDVQEVARWESIPVNSGRFVHLSFAVRNTKTFKIRYTDERGGLYLNFEEGKDYPPTYKAGDVVMLLFHNWASYGFKSDDKIGVTIKRGFLDTQITVLVVEDYPVENGFFRFNTSGFEPGIYEATVWYHQLSGGYEINNGGYGVLFKIEP